MSPEVSELVVLQTIYVLLQNGETAKVSLVKLTNEIRNSVLVRQLSPGETPLDINDILSIVKRVLPNQRISLVDGQLSFPYLQLHELRNEILSRSDALQQAQVQAIQTLEEQILNPKKIDPKREKLLQLYRDTVLNKLNKAHTLDDLYERVPQNPVAKEQIALESIKNDTPSSVHELQFTLQLAICNALASCPSGSSDWQLAWQAQQELADTVQFMRRALE
ncbi:EAF5 (YEL018W) [Zygosaccharomyces parabailii]|uniref:ZYBA0S06-03620g1_1 n=1 Tax=Zygosaccharomyces bailii (strain CLIB 213 / ATCC 58445 / CBS 680 / BCRC 21525 / NBRC 1098 / NCYC 1416 / NRRL Y-2227) TaxID=1333698 RepID=A0A8J2X9A1_ZYGB2|nr:EAF5 (YEL018W) [Zygosaccharomyces parabailii]CDF90225.1 ZYBA0S06-03620g1_1 [Zygosaccharomyces bailii CLIB 213]CDH11551.1 related to Chromatin modification-related protein EAF5 [Zygosaccharomyces bailii ISA1307]SJM84558.1 related to Chromatin modification-related protein EAF5 [Zygosaccharomyces bailii]AQZ18693.1 EAF5 (YEL018W) [Zygosaccharomyces parabailii]